MNTFIETRHLEEIIKQINRTVYCKKAMDAALQKNLIEDFFWKTEHFIQHMSAVSRFLWNPRKSEHSRCSYIREKLKITAESILNNRKLRDNLVHFDERLGKWAAESKHRSFIDQNIGDIHNLICAVSQFDYIRNYNSKDSIYSFCGEEFNIQDIIEEIEKIKLLTEQRLQELALEKFKQKQ